MVMASMATAAASSNIHAAGDEPHHSHHHNNSISSSGVTVSSGRAGGSYHRPSSTASSSAAAGGDVGSAGQHSSSDANGTFSGIDGSEFTTGASEGLGGSYIDTIVKMAIGRIADNVGWNTIGSLSLDILTEVTGKYIQSMGRNSIRFANMSGRTQVTLPDVGLAFNQLHFNLTGLQEYISAVQPHPVPIRVSKVPASIRPSNRIKFACHQPTDTPFGDDIEIGYAVTDSDDDDDDESEVENGSAVADGAEDQMEKDYLSAACGHSGSESSVRNNGTSCRRRRPVKRSEYYESWMPAFPEPEKIAPTPVTPSDHNQNSQSSLKEGTCDSQTEPPLGFGLKISELEPSSHLSSIYFNSAGQIIPANGVTPVEPEKSFPDDSGPESLFESEDEESAALNDSTSAVGPLRGISNASANDDVATPQKPIDKLTIKNTNSLTKSLKQRKKLDKLEKGSKGSTSSKKLTASSSGGKGPLSLSIKVSGLIAGTPTASPKLPASDIPLAPEVEERMDSTISDVIAAVCRPENSPSRSGIPKKNSSKSAAKREAKSSAKKKEKEYSSREFVESDDDSDEDEDQGTTEAKDLISPKSTSRHSFSFPSPSSSSRKVSSPASSSTAGTVAGGRRDENNKKAISSSDTIDSVIKSVLSKASPPVHSSSPSRHSSSPHRNKQHMTPERNHTSAVSPASQSGGGKVTTKAAAKHFPDDSQPPINKIESEAAEILMAFSTKPVETPNSGPTTTSGPSSPPSFSPFNLGKALAAGAFTSFPSAAVSAPITEMIGQTSDIHPFAPNPPPSLPFKTLAMKKAFDDPLPAATPISSSKRSLSPDTDSDEEQEKPVKKIKKANGEDDADDEKRRKKEKKKKKKESRDKEKEKKKKEKKKEKAGSGAVAVDADSSKSSIALSENIPKLSIKIPASGPKSTASPASLHSHADEAKASPPVQTPGRPSKAVKDPKVKKEKEDVKSKTAAASGGCILISETIKQTSSTASSEAKGKVKKEKEPTTTSNKKAPDAKSKTKDSKGKKSDSGKGAATAVTAALADGGEDEEEEDKIWICPACKLPDDGSPMIGCDTCDSWYHWVCVGLKKEPEEDSWFCPRCRDKQKKIVEGLSRSVKKEKRRFDDKSDVEERQDTGRKKKKKKPG